MATLKKKIFPAVFAFLMIASSLYASDVDAPDKVLQAAEEGIAHFLSQIPKGMASEYGLPGDFSPDRIRLLPPFRLHEISPQALNSYSSAAATATLMTATDSWYFPVEYDGSIRSVLVVALMPEGYKAVSFGYCSLGRELSYLLKQWPREKGYTPKLIAINQAKTYLFTIPEHRTSNLTPLSGALQVRSKAAGPKYAPATLAPLSETVERLKPVVSENIKAYKH